MTLDDEMKLLGAVSRAVSDDPVFLEKVLRAGINGMMQESMASRRHASDMEAIAAIALNARMFKNSKNYIAQLLQKWEGTRNALNWKAHIQELLKNPI